MATTTKTLTPTNQTVTLPDMTEKPNASVLVDGIGKDADAINAAYAQIVTVTTGQVALNSPKVTSGTLDVVTCRKTGKLVNVAARVHSITDGTVTAAGTFFTIPDGFRPAATTYGYAYLNIDGAFVPLFASVSTNGDVNINYTGSKYVTQVMFWATYAV